MPDKTVLITGANRGIGRELTKFYLEKGWRVLAAARDPTKVAQEGKVVIIKIDSSSTTDAQEAVEELKNKHNITHLDVVIANAAVAPTPSPLASASISELSSGLITNVSGPLALYQATRPLLSDGDAFVVITSTVGSITGEWMPYLGAYGATKTAVNFIVRGIHIEEPKLKAFAINPGWVNTDMGYVGSTLAGLDAPPDKLSDTVPGIIKVIDEATKEKTSGLLWN
ncbi:hypothetical protein L198_04692 [Cryptococcus wingfieldii CBS 7118]|uniref:Uncharacterized protein n=1 Tax=Cryptococcus wingfieldii CBS 7118 TaxID=1295528 RepID=A0A1E3J371_9TREE|nr:hypothetical protein L198_04692 [Cryptococcus wingfieldii CBS 7118]ODN95299.1 hypothetical protein L198_04692 [Cryptococcus wingfieldii CBS 7118]